MNVSVGLTRKGRQIKVHEDASGRDECRSSQLKVHEDATARRLNVGEVS